MRIVTNEQYIGTYVSKAHNVRVENAIPAIIDRELWDKVQTMIQHNRAGRTPRAGRANYMLSGKLFCQLCDSSMKGISGTGKHGERHYYYSCSKHTAHRCEKRNIEKNYLENLIVAATADYVLAPDKLEQIVDRMIAVQLADQHRDNDEKGMLESELSENIRKQDNIMRAIEDGTGSPRLSARLHDLEKQESILRTQLSAIEKPVVPSYSREQLIFMLSQFQRDPEEQNEEYKQRIIDTFVHAVYLADEIAFVQFNIAAPEKAESTTLESVMLDLIHGKPIAESPENSRVPAGFDRVTCGK